MRTAPGTLARTDRISPPCSARIAACALALLGLSLATVVRAQDVTLLRAVPTLRLDGAKEDIEGEATWQRILASRDGRVMVFNPLDWQFLVFDTAGRRLGKFGGRGDGPGEFHRRAARTQTDLMGGFIGDSIWIPDESAYRITIFGPDTKLVRTTPTPRFDPGEVKSFTPLAVLPQGRLLASAAFSDAPDGALFLIGSRGNIERRLFNFPVDSSVVRGEGGFARVPFRGRPLHAVSPDGTRIAIVTYSSVGIGTGSFRIVMLRNTGDTIYNRTHAFSGKPVTPNMAQDSLRAITFRSATGGRADPPASIVDQVRKRIPTVTKPFGSTAVVGFDGWLWISRGNPATKPPYPPGRWMAIDERGSIAGEVELHYQAKVVAGSQHSVLTTQNDSLGFAQIVRHRVDRPQ